VHRRLRSLPALANASTRRHRRGARQVTETPKSCRNSDRAVQRPEALKSPELLQANILKTEHY